MNIKKLKKLYDASTDKYGDARKMGITYQTMVNILKGSDFKVSSLEGIAKFYGVPVGYFFDEAEADGRQRKELELERLRGQVEGLKESIRILRDGKPKTKGAASS